MSLTVSAITFRTSRAASAILFSLENGSVALGIPCWRSMLQLVHEMVQQQYTNVTCSTVYGRPVVSSDKEDTTMHAVYLGTNTNY